MKILILGKFHNLLNLNKMYSDTFHPSNRNNQMFALIDKADKNTNRAYMLFGIDMIDKVKECFPDKDIIKASEANKSIIRGIEAFTITAQVDPYNDYHFIRTTPVGMSTEEAYLLINKSSTNI